MIFPKVNNSKYTNYYFFIGKFSKISSKRLEVLMSTKKMKVLCNNAEFSLKDCIFKKNQAIFLEWISGPQM